MNTPIASPSLCPIYGYAVLSPAALTVAYAEFDAPRANVNGVVHVPIAPAVWFALQHRDFPASPSVALRVVLGAVVESSGRAMGTDTRNYNTRFRRLITRISEASSDLEALAVALNACAPPDPSERIAITQAGRAALERKV